MKNKAAIFLSGLFLSLVFFCLMHSMPIRGDSHSYDAIGRNLSSGNGFSQARSAPYVPTMIREPGYPFFLAFLYAIFGHNYWVVYLIQALLHAFTGIMIFYLADRLFNRAIAYLSAFLTVLSPTLANYTSVLLSETLFTFLLVASLVFLKLAADKKRAVFFALTGISFGITALTKAVALPLFILLIAGLIVSSQNRKGLARNCIICAFLFLLTVSSWGIRNYMVFKNPSITSRAKSNLYNRAVKLTYSREQLKAYALSCFSSNLAKKEYPQYANEEFLYSRTRQLMSTEGDINGVYNEKFEAVLGKEAADIIKGHPVKFIAFSFFELIKLLSFSHLPILSRLDPGIIFLNVFLKLLGYLLFISAVAGAFFYAKNWRGWLSIFLVIFYFFGIYCLFDADARYAVPVIPFLLIFASAALLKKKDKVILPHEAA